MLKSPQAEVERKPMLKVVVFDSGYGGELFADYLEQNLPIVEIIRVIDWRNASKITSRPKAARKITETAIKPYIGRVNLIILANYFLTITNLKYFRRKYKDQKFLGLDLKRPDNFVERDTLILTTKLVARTVNYYNFLFRLKCHTKTITLDSWPSKIDNGELMSGEAVDTLELFSAKEKFYPKNVILACSHFNDIKPELRTCFGGNLKIHDSFDAAYRKTCKMLKLRGGAGKKK